MDTIQLNSNYVLEILLGIGILAFLVLFDFVQLGFLLMGIVLLLVGTVGQVAHLRNASPRVRSYINTLGLIGIGGAMISMMVLEGVLSPGIAIAAVTILVLALVPTEHLSGALAWGGMTVGLTVAAVVEVLLAGSLLFTALLAGMAVVSAALLVRSLLRPADETSRD